MSKIKIRSLTLLSFWSILLLILSTQVTNLLWCEWNRSILSILVRRICILIRSLCLLSECLWPSNHAVWLSCLISEGASDSDRSSWRLSKLLSLSDVLSRSVRRAVQVSLSLDTSGIYTGIAVERWSSGCFRSPSICCFKSLHSVESCSSLLRWSFQVSRPALRLESLSWKNIRIVVKCKKWWLDKEAKIVTWQLCSSDFTEWSTEELKLVFKSDWIEDSCLKSFSPVGIFSSRLWIFLSNFGNLIRATCLRLSICFSFSISLIQDVSLFISKL